MNSRLVGSQRPAHSLIPKWVENDAEDAVFLSSAYGLVPDEWQRVCLEAMLGRRRDGSWAASRCGLSVPRQNGKNGVLEVVELYQMVALGRKILHTAHEVKTARKAFLRLASFFDNPRKFPELAEMCREIRKTNGQEAIVLDNGGSCEFVARSKGSGRGFTVDTLVMDEAQELPEEALAALLPTISASPSKNPQQIVLGTPPGPRDQGEVWTKMHDQGHEGCEKRLAWLEWSAIPPVTDLDDQALWAQANPALGNRLNIDTLFDERAAMDDETFMRERLGMWSAEESARVIPLEDWDACADPNVVFNADDPVALAVDVSPARSVASIAAAGFDVDGKPWVDVIETRAGIPDWVVPRLVEIQSRQNVRAVVIDGLSPAASFIDLLKQKRVRPTVTSASNMAAASAGFYDAVMTGRLAHYNQPALNLAVAVARRRRIGEAWGWSRKQADSDITPLVSATLALFGLSFSDVKRVSSKKKARKVVVY